MSKIIRRPTTAVRTPQRSGSCFATDRCGRSTTTSIPTRTRIWRIGWTATTSTPAVCNGAVLAALQVEDDVVVDEARVVVGHLLPQLRFRVVPRWDGLFAVDLLGNANAIEAQAKARRRVRR